ncbi:TonB-dependent receptor [Sphingomonas sp. LHG3406-1]|uniref:TonB-dependent receptor domain-containing protein n=1 Tax=Sphingomonas sp. LHG3406-1 TaxID=2804617 RepID=UPI002602ADF0|nr:TonB-dependent receptor [Sphingomonas sp. LHG3406-1]
MRHFTTRSLLLASTIAAGIAATPAAAQSNAPAPGNDTQATDEVVEATSDANQPTGDASEIVVTGSRIVRPNLTANSPIAVVTGEQTVAQGDITLDTYLNTLPQVNPSGTTTSNNPGNAGQANLNLRGLGSNRNLVLIDGRRPMVSATDQTVDLNTIPQGLIERIEVITGGAGAAYGADAISGVANIILRRNFEGLELRAGYSNSLPETDAMEYQISGVLGANFSDGRGNVVISGEFSDRQGLIKSQRAFASQATSTTGVPPTGRLIENNAIPQAAIDALFNGVYGVPLAQTPRSGLSQLHFNSDGTLFGSGTFNSPLNVSNYRYDPLGGDSAAANQNFFPDFYSYNFDAINLLVLPLTRRSAFVKANYEIDPKAEVFVQAGYTDYSSVQALAPTPIGVRIYNPATPGGASFATSPLINTGVFITNSVIPVTNPFIPAQLATLLAARTGDDTSLVGSGATEPFRFAIRTLGAGLRESTYDSTVTQALGGLRGEIVGDWRYEAYWSYGKTVIDRSAAGNINVQRLQQLLEAPDGGASLCAGGYNPFGVQPVSQACVDYLSVTGFTSTEFTQNVGQAFATGSLFALPAGNVRGVLGIEKRDFTYDFDPGALSGPIAGFNTASPVNGRNGFLDYFGELYVPLLKDQGFAKNLDVTFGYRRSRSNAENVRTAVETPKVWSNAYKIEASWQPIDPVRIRGSFQRSVRAPNFGELFSGGASFVSAFDPCSNGTNFRATRGTAGRDLCIQNGVGGGSIPASGPFTPTTAQINAFNGFAATPGLQVNTNFTGNINLKPEKANTFTVGGVFEALGIIGSIDYYNIKVSDKIFGPDTNLIIAACYGYLDGYNATLAATNDYCRSITRAGSNLSSVSPRVAIGGDGVNFLSVNQGIVKTSGIDVQLAWKIPTRFMGPKSQINFDTYVNYLINFKNEELPGVVLDYAGTVSYFGQGLGTSFPEWKGTANINWQVEPFTWSNRIRYIDAMKNRGLVQFAGESSSFTGVGSVWYFDTALQWDFLKRYTFRIGVNNLFNKQPPTYSPNVQSGTDPSLYDVVGRRGFVQARLKF